MCTASERPSLAGKVSLSVTSRSQSDSPQLGQMLSTKMCSFPPPAGQVTLLSFYIMCIINVYLDNFMCKLYLCGLFLPFEAQQR